MNSRCDDSIRSCSYGTCAAFSRTTGSAWFRAALTTSCYLMNNGAISMCCRTDVQEEKAGGWQKNYPRVISKSKFHKVRASSFTNSKNIVFYLHLIRKTNYTVLSLLLPLNKIVGAFTSTWSQMSANKLWFDFLTSKVKKWTVTRILILMGNMYMCKNKRTLKKELYVPRLHWCPNVVGVVFILRDKPGAFCLFLCVIIWCLDNHM